MSLESGRYMETVGKNASATSVLLTDLYSRVDEYVLTYPSIYLGFLKICLGVNLDQGSSNKNLMFTRRYLDPNRVSYEVTFFVYL